MPTLLPEDDPRPAQVPRPNGSRGRRARRVPTTNLVHMELMGIALLFVVLVLAGTLPLVVLLHTTGRRARPTH
ncbi:hypothetical protein [Longimycelium tulufanense]|uniref:hypothetical protein n=1 Tax=Longimycelium tulufanense TaxID=907463 RepID=UPI00166F0D4A|nr:hypothetical protein [Longimycelium tulufanense]